LGDYFYLTEIGQDPHVVANFLKKVLYCMKEPLCTYKLYLKFREIGEIPKDKKVDKIKEAC
jgi:hypothetical protein